MNKKVLIAISGGVDSSLAAHCLLENGYDVTGLFMQFFSSGQRRDLEKAAAVSARLKIPLSVLVKSSCFIKTDAKTVTLTKNTAINRFFLFII